MECALPETRNCLGSRTEERVEKEEEESTRKEPLQEKMLRYLYNNYKRNAKKELFRNSRPGNIIVICKYKYCMQCSYPTHTSHTLPEFLTYCSIYRLSRKYFKQIRGANVLKRLGRLKYYSVITSIRSENMRPNRTTHSICHSHPSLFT